MSQKIADVREAIISWLKTHPVGSFIMTLVPIIGLAFTIAFNISNLFYQSTIAEYRSQIDTLRSSGTLETIVQSKNISSPEKIYIRSNCDNQT